MERWITFLATPCRESRPVWFRALYESYQWPDGTWVSRLVPGPGNLVRIMEPQPSLVAVATGDVLLN